MCYDGLFSLHIDDMWDLFESLAWHCKSASESFMCPSPPPYVLHAQSPSIDQFRNLCNNHSFYPISVCSCCQSFNHDVNSYPYCDLSNESHARLNVPLPLYMLHCLPH